MNLSSLQRSSSRISTRKRARHRRNQTESEDGARPRNKLLTWFGGHAHAARHLVAEGARHRQPGNVLALQPHAQRSNRVLVRVAERVDPTAAVDDALGLVVLRGLLVPTDGLRDDLVVRQLDNDAAGVAHVHAEQLLPERHDGHAGRAGEADVHHAAEELLVAVQERVVERDADLVRVQLLVCSLLQQLLIVLLEHKAHLGFDELGQPLLHERADFAAVLAVAVGDSEEVAVLEAAEVGHSDPRVLVRLVGIRRRLPGLGSEGELGHAVREHLPRVRRVVAVLLRGRLRAPWLLLAGARHLLRLLLAGQLQHLLVVLRLRITLQVHVGVLDSEGHLLGLHLVRLLDDGRFVCLAHKVTVLHLNLGQLVAVDRTLLRALQEAVQVALGPLVVAPRVESSGGVCELLRGVLAVGRAEEAVADLAFHGALLAREAPHGGALRCRPCGRLVRVLRLRPLRDVLQDVTLDLHVTLRLLPARPVHVLDESVQVVVGHLGVLPSRSAVYALLVEHTAILVGHTQPEVALALLLSLRAGRGATDVAPHARADLLLDQLLVVLVLLRVLLQKLAQARVQLIIPLLRALRLALLRRGLRPIKESSARGV